MKKRLGREVFVGKGASMLKCRRFVVGLVLVLSLNGVSPVWALEKVTLSAPDASEALRDDLRAVSLSYAVWREGQDGVQDVLAAAQADYARLTRVLYARGRYSGVIHIRVDGREAAELTVLDAPNDIREIAISVVPGPVFKFGDAELRPVPQRFNPPDGFAPGQVAHSGAVQEALDAGISAWRAAGHAKATLGQQNLRADHSRARLDAELIMEPGPQLRFGALHLDAESKVREARIRKIAGFPTGETFSPSAMEDVAGRLRRTGVFRSVALHEAESPNADGTLDVTARIVDEKQRRLGFGAEYSTIEGATINGYWVHRNLLGGAERLRVEGEVSGITGETGGVDVTLGARYTRPATPKPDTDLFVAVTLERLDEPDFLSRQYGFAVGLERRFSDTREGSVAVEWEHFDVEDVSGNASLDVLSLPVTLTEDRRDVPLDATRGFFVQTELRPFAGFGDTSSGLRVSADARAYRQLGERLVLAGRLQFGAVAGPSVRNAPPDYLFYSGGGGTVRGQSYQSLDIDLGGGLRRGGRSFLGSSIEARFDVTGDWGGVVFADAGYIGAESFPDGSGEWHAGAGFGVRYDTGIGPIRFDLGVPIGGSGSGAQIYIGIGQAF